MPLAATNETEKLMRITGEIQPGEVEIRVDVDDITGEIDWEEVLRDNSNVESEIGSLLDDYSGSLPVCGTGKSFERAVWKAIDRRPEHDHTVLADDVRVIVTKDDVRRVIREELKEMFRLGVNSLG